MNKYFGKIINIIDSTGKALDVKLGKFSITTDTKYPNKIVAKNDSNRVTLNFPIPNSGGKKRRLTKKKKSGKIVPHAIE